MLIKKNKVIVSGATGFIGRHLIPILLDNGYNVIAVGRNIKKAQTFKWFKNVKFVAFDMNDKNEYKNLDGANGLIHLAWQGLQNYDSLIHTEKNSPNSYRFIKSLVKLGIKQILVSGSCAEYGFKSGAISSNSKTYPVSVYAKAKNDLRKKLTILSKKYPFDLQWARIFYLFGEGQNEKSLFSQLEKAINNNDKEFKMSGGEQLRDYLPVEEVAKQIFDLYHKNKNGIHNICSGQPISIKKLVNNHLKKRNSRININFGFFPYDDNEPMEFWGIKNN